MARRSFFQVDQSDVGSPLRDVTEEELRDHGHCFEFLALLSFTDNRTSRAVEVSKRCVCLFEENRYS